MKKNKQINTTNTRSNFGKYYLLLAIVVFVVFANTLFNGYNMDDHLVTQNHVYTSKGLSAIKDILSSSYYSNNIDINFDYRPLVHISFAIEHQLFGEHAGVSHFINLLIYLITVLLLFKLCIKLFGENLINAALLASLIFAVHPLHTETVASIKNRDELLALILGLTSLYLAIKYTGNKTITWLMLASLAFTMGMLAKKSIYPIAIIAPAVILSLKQSTLKNTILIALVFALPSAFAGSDLQFNKGLLLFVLPFIGILLTHLLINVSYYTSHLKNYLLTIPVNTVLITLSVITFTLGFMFKEIVIVIPAIILTVLLPKSNRPSVLVLIALQITLTAFLFDVKLFHRIALIPAIACIVFVVNLSHKKKTDYLVLALALLPLLAYLIVHKSLTSVGVFVELTLYFLLLNRKALWGLGFMVFSTTLAALFFQSFVYHYFLIGYSVLKVVSEYVTSNKLNFDKPIIKLSLAMAATIGILYSNQVHSPLGNKINQQYQRFQSEYLNDKPLKSNDKGRTINYIENTLSGKYTRAEILATGFATIAEYARLTLYPNQLSFYYGYARVKTVNFSDVKVWLGLLFYLALVAVALWQLRKNTLISIGIAWYLINITLFSNWIEPVAGMVGERLAYTASVGFCIAVSAFVVKFKPTLSLHKPEGLELFLILILVLFSIRSISRNSDWKDSITLMEHDIEHLENSAQAHNLLALNLMYMSSNGKKLSEQEVITMQNKAAFHLQKSVDIYPYFFNTNFDLARVYIGLGEFTKAKIALEQALKIDSENLFALEELAKTCYELKLAAETETYANMYLAKIPQNENMHEILIYNMLINNKYESAMYYAERAMSYYPNNEIIQRMYADAKRLSGNTPTRN